MTPLSRTQAGDLNKDLSHCGNSDTLSSLKSDELKCCLHCCSIKMLTTISMSKVNSTSTSVVEVLYHARERYHPRQIYGWKVKCSPTSDYYNNSENYYCLLVGLQPENWQFRRVLIEAGGFNPRFYGIPRRWVRLSVNMYIVISCPSAATSPIVNRGQSQGM